MLKNLIISIAEAGLTQRVYFDFQNLAFVGVFFCILWYGKKYKMGMVKAIAVFAIVYPVTDFWKRVLFWIETGFQRFGGENFIRVVIWIPIFGLAVAKLLKIDKKKVCDFMAPAVILSFGIGHFGCIFAGCCSSFPVSWGLYNIQTGMNHFPNQPIEAIVALLIFVYLLWYSQKHNYVPDGKLYPIMLILFGFSRFFFEFLRDNDKIILGCSGLAFHALMAGSIGVAWLGIMKHREQRYIEDPTTQVN